MKPSFLSTRDFFPSTWLRTGFWLDVVRWSGILCLLLPGLSGCLGSEDNRLVARPAGPYQLTLDLGSTLPQAGQETILTFHLTHTKTQQPVSDLQILHERALHTFIVSRDLSTFAHTHHEDYIPLTDQDLQRARFHFPYTFPKAGQYRIVNEFTHKDRSWDQTFHADGYGGVRPVAQARFPSGKTVWCVSRCLPHFAFSAHCRPRGGDCVSPHLRRGGPGQEFGSLSRYRSPYGKLAPGR